MGMMFLDALSSSMATNQSFGDALQCNKTDQCCSIIGVVDICLEKFNATNGVDAFFSFFTFSIVNIVGVMLLYFMVFAVMKSSEITKDATDKIQ
jgi:hypothetical protein